MVATNIGASKESDGPEAKGTESVLPVVVPDSLISGEAEDVDVERPSPTAETATVVSSKEDPPHSFEDDVIGGIQPIPTDHQQIQPQVGAHAIRTGRPGGNRDGASSGNSSDDHDTIDDDRVEQGLVEAQLVQDTDLVIAEQVPDGNHKDIPVPVEHRSRTLLFAGVITILVLALVIVIILLVTKDSREDPNVPSIDTSSFPDEDACLESSQELMDAMDGYLVDNSASSRVALKYGWPIGSWCVSNITRFALVFRSDRTRSPELFSNFSSEEILSAGSNMSVAVGGWDVSSAIDMEEMFRGLKNLSSVWGLQHWNMSSVVSLKATFMDTEWSEEPDLSRWDTSSVETMQQLFRWSHVEKPVGIEKWDTRNVVDLGLLAELSPTFNADISKWDTRSVTTIQKAFMDAPKFDQDISSWSTASLTDMNNAFRGATSFNQPIGSWDVSKVRAIAMAFDGAAAFNQPLSNWNVFKLVRMKAAFRGASNFSQNLCHWMTLLPEHAEMTDMFKGTACPNPSDPVLSEGGPFCFDCNATDDEN